MQLLTKQQRVKLLANGVASRRAMEDDGNTPDHKPVVKLFDPYGKATWLLSELDPDHHDIAFGLCDLGMGSPELGSVSLAEIEAIKFVGQPRIERDRLWTATKTLTQYADEAREEGTVKA